MRRELRCIFPNVYKIPADCINKSIFKSCLEEAPQKLLRQVAESKVAYLSPFDSAAILNKLIENTNDKGISELRRDPLYRPAASKLVGSIERYRQELLFYFMLKFYKLHDICAIKSITRVFVERQATRIQNINQLVDLLYHLAHHIPKEIRSDDTVKDQPEYYQEWQEGSNEDHVHVCRKFIRDIQRELVGKIQELRDSTLIYKLIVSLNKLPKTEYTRGILKGVQERVTIELGKNNWNCRHLKKIVTALVYLDVVDSDMLQRIVRSLEFNQDNFDNRDIKEIIQVLDRFDIQSNHLYISLRDKLEINKQIKGKTKTKLNHTN